MSKATLIRRGRAHVFGDNVPLDEGVMAFKFAIGRVTDPAELIPHLFEPIAPGFASRVATGDIVVAGTEFGCGKPHIQGFIAMAALEMGVVCGSIPYRALRGAVSRGLPVLTEFKPPPDWVTNGDELEVDYQTGIVRNLSRDRVLHADPMPQVLQGIISQGGARGQLSAWLSKHPGQRLPGGSPSVLLPGSTVKVVRKPANTPSSP